MVRKSIHCSYYSRFQLLFSFQTVAVLKHTGFSSETNRLSLKVPSLLRLHVASTWSVENTTQICKSYIKRNPPQVIVLIFLQHKAGVPHSMVFTADILTGHSRESTGGSVPLNVPLSRVSEPGCTKAGPPLSGTQPSLIHLCFPCCDESKSLLWKKVYWQENKWQIQSSLPVW